MDVSEDSPFTNDLLRFTGMYKEDFVEVVGEELENLRALKVGFGINVTFSIMNADGEKEEKVNCFKSNEPYIFFPEDGRNRIEEEFNRFIQRMTRKINEWSKNGSDWEYKDVDRAYINVVNYEPLRGGSYLPLPPKLKNKRAIVHVKNTDNECLK